MITTHQTDAPAASSDPAPPAPAPAPTAAPTPDTRTHGDGAPADAPAPQAAAAALATGTGAGGDAERLLWAGLGPLAAAHRLILNPLHARNGPEAVTDRLAALQALAQQLAELCEPTGGHGDLAVLANFPTRPLAALDGDADPTAHIIRAAACTDHAREALVLAVRQLACAVAEIGRVITGEPGAPHADA